MFLITFSLPQNTDSDNQLTVLKKGVNHDKQLLSRLGKPHINSPFYRHINKDGFDHTSQHGVLNNQDGGLIERATKLEFHIRKTDCEFQS